jgi:hypothetical protein
VRLGYIFNIVVNAYCETATKIPKLNKSGFLLLNTPAAMEQERRQRVSREDLAEILNVVQDIISRLDRISNADEIDGLLLRIDMVKTRVVNLDLDDLLMETLNRVYNVLAEINANPPSRAGRPFIDVNENQVRFLLDQNFKVAQISWIIGVGKRTLERRMNSFGLEYAK